MNAPTPRAVLARDTPTPTIPRLSIARIGASRARRVTVACPWRETRTTEVVPPLAAPPAGQLARELIERHARQCGRCDTMELRQAWEGAA